VSGLSRENRALKNVFEKNQGHTGLQDLNGLRLGEALLVHPVLSGPMLRAGYEASQALPADNTRISVL